MLTLTTDIRIFEHVDLVWNHWNFRRHCQTQFQIMSVCWPVECCKNAVL